MPIKACKDFVLNVCTGAMCKYLFSNIQPILKLISIIIATAALGVGANKMHGVMVVITSNACFKNGNLVMRASSNLNTYEYVDTKVPPAKIPRMTSMG